MKLATLVAVGALFLLIAPPSVGEDEPTRMLITNVVVWDGISEDLVPADVLIEDNLIADVASGLSSPNATRIDGQGGTVIPGLIDMHAHFCNVATIW